jgi:heme a synthase
MRHQHAGLAIPDFPLAHGRLWPAMDAAAIQNYNARRVETTAANPITAFQIGLQMAHRLMALAILICVGTVTWRMGAPVSDPARTARGSQRAGSETDALLRRLAIFWLGLIFIQIGLGAWTIWSNKAADVATAHVLVGALSLVTGVLGCLICFRRLARGREAQGAPVSGVPCTQRPAVAINS